MKMENNNLSFDAFKNIPTAALSDITTNKITDDMTGETGTFNNTIHDQATEDLFKDFGSSNQPGQQPGTQLNAGSLITGEMAVSFMDIIIPTALVLLFKKAMDKTVSKKSFALTTDEKNTIKPVLQNYLNSINFNVQNPLNALILTMGMIYGMKAIEVMNEVPNGKFAAGTPGIGQPTQAGHIKTDGRGRPKGTTKKKPL